MHGRYSAGDQVRVDGTQLGVVERSVGGDDYIVKVGGERRAVAGFRMRPANEAPQAGMGPGGMPLHPAKLEPEAPAAPPAPAPAE